MLSPADWPYDRATMREARDILTHLLHMQQLGEGPDPDRVDDCIRAMVDITNGLESSPYYDSAQAEGLMDECPARGWYMTGLGYAFRRLVGGK